MICAVVVSLPNRHKLLCEALTSVQAQTLQPDDTVVGIDPYRYGEVGNMNRLIDATDCEWLAFLHDDDLWLADHLAMAAKHFDTADVIVSRVTTVGRPQSTLEPQHDDFADLRRTNWFPPSAVVVRKSAFGHWTPPPNEPPNDWVDWSNWRRLLEAGARFVHTNEPTMLYRFGPWKNGSWG
jgi:hypothetical protein